ncbi:MAG: hypothetical protein JSW61_07365 [Candidatus Thorarchaeota archaeon]|nr:MAG: hypothetical protein JSW61_07365 [Candidatus Thorarchaeota archaeon]
MMRHLRPLRISSTARRQFHKSSLLCITFLMLLGLPALSAPTNLSTSDLRTPILARQSLVADYGPAYSGTGTSWPTSLHGSIVNNSIGTVRLDALSPAAVDITTHSGWSTESANLDIDQLTTSIDDVLVNGDLNSYHSERRLGLNYNQITFYVPDGWTVLKNESGAGLGRRAHPDQGIFELNNMSGVGVEGSMRWSFDTWWNIDYVLTKYDEVFLRQQISAPWRKIHSAEVRFLYRVSSASDQLDQNYLFVRVNGYEVKFHVLEPGISTNTWLPAVAQIPITAFASFDNPYSIPVDIGMGTDLDGVQTDQKGSYLGVDNVEMTLTVEPFPEQVNLMANSTPIVETTIDHVSPYVPDGANRDCYSAPDSNGGSGGVDLSGYSNNGILDVGADVPAYPDWSTAFPYQVGLQFPLDVPQGSAITSARFEVESAGGSGVPGMRIYVANEDTVPAFTSGYPLLPDRFNWSDTGIEWFPSDWTADTRYLSPEISVILQQVVSRPGWQSGNYICIMLEYGHSNIQYSYNQIKGSWGSFFAERDLARLYVDFLSPGSHGESFKFSKDLTIDHNKVSANLTDFPVLVEIFDSDLHTDAQSDGSDIAFTMGTETLYHQFVIFNQTFNSTHAHLLTWVKVPFLSSVVDTVFTMHYGNENSGSGGDPKVIWSEEYENVLHLDESSGPGSYLLDSTSNYHHGRPSATGVTSVEGLIDDANYFSGGSGDSIELEDGASIFNGWYDWQLSFWAYFDYTDDSQFNEKRVFDKTTSLRLARTLWSGGNPHIQIDIDFATAPTQYVGVDVTRQEWNYIVYKYESSGDGYLHIFNFINGLLYDYGSVNIGLGDRLVYDSSDFALGCVGGGTPLTGTIDEFRTIGNGFSSDAWLETEAINQYDPEGFISVSNEKEWSSIADLVLEFTTDSTSEVSFEPTVLLNVGRASTSLDSELNPGVSFTVTNDSNSVWTARAGISAPQEILNLGFTLEYPDSEWVPVSVTNPLGVTKAYPSDWTYGSGELLISPSAIDVQGIWIFTFNSTNHADDLQMRKAAGTYAPTARFTTNDVLEFRSTATDIVGSAAKLILTDPSGDVWGTFVDSSQSAGEFTFTGIVLDSSADAGLWQSTIQFNDSGSSVGYRAGLFQRTFIVTHNSSIQLRSPSEAAGGGVAVRTAGSILYIEVNLTDDIGFQPITGAVVKVNWTVSGSPTEITLIDYGDGRYGRSLNTSDLEVAGRWRIEIESYHQYFNNATDYFELDLLHGTRIVYESPDATPVGDNFTIRMRLENKFDGSPISGATITANQSYSVIDHNNGTYELDIDGSGLGLGTFGLELTADPSEPYLMDSSVVLTVTHRQISTEMTASSTEPGNVPWGQYVNATLTWTDVDHSDIGIPGGVPASSATFDWTDLGSGLYSIRIDVRQNNPGVYSFSFTMSKSGYEDSTTNLVVNIVPHQTRIVASHNVTVPWGSDTYVDLQFEDLDLGGAAIVGNITDIVCDWGTGSSTHFMLQFWIGSSSWGVGTYTIDITLRTTPSPKFYNDVTTVIQVTIRKLETKIEWTPVGVFPVGDDFEMTLNITIDDQQSASHGNAVDDLILSNFSIVDGFSSPYSIESFNNLGSGIYNLSIDSSAFPEGNYSIRIYLFFSASGYRVNTQTPNILFSYQYARSRLWSQEVQPLSVPYNTNTTIRVFFDDIDRNQGITGTSFVAEGATIIDVNDIGNGEYVVTFNTSDWVIGTYDTNLTASATGYDNQTLEVSITIRQIETYAVARVGFLNIPIGDSKIFKADYIDMDHDTAISPATALCNWSAIHYSVSWVTDHYEITINTFDTDTPATYFLMFNITKDANYKIGYFNISVTIRTINTSLQLIPPVEPTTPIGYVYVTVYYKDLDHDLGIVSSFVDCIVRNSTGGLVTKTWSNITGNPGYYNITFAASQLDGLGIHSLTVYFNWTGSVQKYQNRTLSVDVTVEGEKSSLTLIDASLPSPCLSNMTYTFLYASLTTGEGITNATSGVFISVNFVGTSVDLSQVDIWEANRTDLPGYYSIRFNSTFFGRVGLFSMRVHINWSRYLSPYYSNRTDLVSIRILSRDTQLSVIPPTSTAFGENATFSFTYQDVTGGLSELIAYNSTMMDVSLSLAEFALQYDSPTRVYTVSFNTSQFGAPLGERTIVLNVTWSGIPFYGNRTGNSISVTITIRQTVLTYATPPRTLYGDNVSFIITYSDVTGATSQGVSGAAIGLQNNSMPIPLSYYSVSEIGGGEYEIELSTEYFGQPGAYDVTIAADAGVFYIDSDSVTRVLTVTYRRTFLVAEYSSTIPYNTSIRIVLHYQDLSTLDDIGNESGIATSLQIMNGGDWIFSCTWRSVQQDYLLVVETYNQALDIQDDHFLLLNMSASFTSPFYLPAILNVTYVLEERPSVLNQVAIPPPTRYLGNLTLTVVYKDILSGFGVDGAEISVYNGSTPLSESTDYVLLPLGLGYYVITINTTSLGSPGLKIVRIVAAWTLGSPYHANATVNSTIIVTERPTNVEILVPPTQVQYLNNITCQFAFLDLERRKVISIVSGDIDIYSNHTLLSTNDYTLFNQNGVFLLSVNSTVLNSRLISSWNLSIAVSWNNTEPYYRDDLTTLWITTTNRKGSIIPGQILPTPLGDLMRIEFDFIDLSTGVGIADATVLFECLEVAGLIEGDDYWVTDGTGPETGKYKVDVDTSSLGSVATFNFLIGIQWNSTLSPYYANITSIPISGVARLIKTTVVGGLPDPSILAYYQNFSFVVNFTDIDHDMQIDGAESAISVLYRTSGLPPSDWTINPLSGGLYNITVNATDLLSEGLHAISVSVDYYPYQITEVDVVFLLTARRGVLSANVVESSSYAGNPVTVLVNLTDADANDAPLGGASLDVTWGDTWSSETLGVGSFRLTLATTNINHGTQTLEISATLSYYSIANLSVSFVLNPVPTELIMTWEGPDPARPNVVFWGEELAIYAAFNDTLRGVLIPSAQMTCDWGGINITLVTTGVPGNYTATLNSSLVQSGEIATALISAMGANYQSALGRISVQIQKRPIAIEPLGSDYSISASKGADAVVTVLIKDAISDVSIQNAVVTLDWAFAAGLSLTPVNGSPGYYSVAVGTTLANIQSYPLSITASAANYTLDSIDITLSVTSIESEIWLDETTSGYETSSVVWSEVVRIGVYVLAPSLNPSDPMSTGIPSCLVTWFSPELARNGTLLDDGMGYYYFDFSTNETIPGSYTFRINAHPTYIDYKDSTNSTIVVIRRIPTQVFDPGAQDVFWSWGGHFNMTYWDTFREVGISSANSSYSWAGGSGELLVGENGTYMLPVDTFEVKPGLYKISVRLWKRNHEDARTEFYLRIKEVPTELAVLLPSYNHVEGAENVYQVPFGDMFDITLFYNNTLDALGIGDAEIVEAYYSGPGLFEVPIPLDTEVGGNYSIHFDTTQHVLNGVYTITVRMVLENRTEAEISFDVMIIQSPTEAEIEGTTAVSLYYRENETIWIHWVDIWPDHGMAGIEDANVSVSSSESGIVDWSEVHADPSRPGWYSITLTAFSSTGLPNIVILFEKEYYDSASVTVTVSVGPSPEDVRMQLLTTYGSAILLLFITAVVVYVRVLRVPKIVRAMVQMISKVRKRRIPKVPAGIRSRREILAEIYNEMYGPIGVKTKPEKLPVESVIIEVPLIEELMLDLSILTNMTADEFDDFRFEVTKMKMSEQTTFVQEVIKQEIGRIERLTGKSQEEILEEVSIERERRMEGMEPAELVPEELIEEDRMRETEVPSVEAEPPEDRLSPQEIEKMSEELLKRGMPLHEIEELTTQARQLPKDVGEMLLKGLWKGKEFEDMEGQPIGKVEVVEDRLTEEELAELKKELERRGIGPREVQSMVAQARELHRDLVEELLLSTEEREKLPVPKEEDRLTEKEIENLRAELEQLKVPKDEIETILRQARAVPKELVGSFLDSIRSRAPLLPEEEVEDRIVEFSIEDLEKKLLEKGIPREEIDQIIAQAKVMDESLLSELLKSLDLEED